MPAPYLLPGLLAAEGSGVAASPSVLLVGEVDYDGGPDGPSTIALAGPGAARGGKVFEFQPLPLSGEEIRRVAESFAKENPAASVLELRGADATESAFREKAPGFRFVHVATHGFFAPEEVSSALAGPASGERRFELLGAAADLTGWHPGLLSGIVLARVNRRPEPGADDGIQDASAGLEGGVGHAEPSSRLQAVVTLAAPADLAADDLPERARETIRRVFGDAADDLRRASPVSHVTAHAPPFLILHGERDESVPVTQSRNLHERPQAAGTGATLVLVKNAGHVFEPRGAPTAPSRAEVTRMIAEFFDRVLGSRMDRAAESAPRERERVRGLREDRRR